MAARASGARLDASRAAEDARWVEVGSEVARAYITLPDPVAG